MDKAKLVDVVKKAREASEQKKFTQSIDLVMNLLQNPKEKIEVEELIPLTGKLSRQNKICALVGGELKAEAEKYCDKVILDIKFGEYKTPRTIRALRNEYDFFIAQGNIMAEIAKVFGKYLSTVNKMPNPKFGLIVPPTAKLGPLVEKLKNCVVARAKKAPVVQVRIGDEKMEDAAIAENAAEVIDLVTAKLPHQSQSIRNIIIKTTMGKPVKV